MSTGSGPEDPDRREEAALTTTIITERRVREFFDACNARDIDRIASFFSDDAVYLGSIGPDDDGTAFIGGDEVRRGMAAFLGSHSEVRYSDVEVVLAGERGFATWTFTGTRLDGEEYTYRGVDILTFRGGLIARKDAFRKERSSPIGG